MKWAVRLALGLYPQWWRRRYGRELEALVEDSMHGWSTVFDVARGALVMQMKDFRIIPLLAALVGAFMATVLYVRAPALYASSSTIRLTGSSVGDPKAEWSLALRTSLADAVPTADLRSISVILMDSGSESALVRISHTAPSAEAADRVTRKLVAAALGGSGRAATRGTVLEEEVTAERAGHPVWIPLGAAFGGGLGAAFVVLRRRTSGPGTGA